MLAAVVIEVAARFLLEGMHEQTALIAARYDDAPDRVEVLARLLLGPGGAARRDGLEPQRRPAAVTGDAPGVSRPLGEEDRLNFVLEVVVVERRLGRRR